MDKKRIMTYCTGEVKKYQFKFQNGEVLRLKLYDYLK